MDTDRALIGGTVPTYVRAWLSTIAWRRALDMTRREREVLPLDADPDGHAVSGPDPRRSGRITAPAPGRAAGIIGGL